MRHWIWSDKIWTIEWTSHVGPAFWLKALMISLGLDGSLFFSQSLSLSLYPAQHDYASSLEAFFPLMGHGLDSHFLSLFCLSLSLDQKLQWLRPQVQLMNDSFFNCLEIGMDAFILSFRAKINRDDRVFFACWSTQAGKFWSWITCKEIKYTIIGRDLCVQPSCMCAQKK